jgi:phosphoribosylanthranilate isomerase
MIRNLLIKVCGIKSPVNREALSASGIDLMGFIFYPRSKRYIGNLPEAEKKQLFATPVPRVGVFVNEKIPEVLHQAEKYALSYIQLHGDEDPAYCREVRKAGFHVIKSFGISSSFSFASTSYFTEVSDYFLFDTKAASYGGTGKKFNWTLLDQYTGEKPFLLSGGIQPEDANLLREIRHPKLAGFDLNSGFEDHPGWKNIHKINAFIHTLKRETL